MLFTSRPELGRYELARTEPFLFATRDGLTVHGYADIVRELIDGAAGLQPGNNNLPSSGEAWWQGYRARLERIAQESAMRENPS